MGICDGRVVIVTGSGRGHRPRARARVRRRGRQGRRERPRRRHARRRRVAEPRDGGRRGDQGAWAARPSPTARTSPTSPGAGRMVQRAIDTFGRLDTLVNNAGILRDRMLTNMEESRVGRGDRGAPQGCVRADPSRGRVLARAGEGRRRRSNGRIVNTSSPSGVFGNAGQTNYGAAKAGIAAFTIICGLELGRYGVLRERDRPGRAHAHDRGPRMGGGGAAGGGVRRARSREHLAARRVARLQRQRRRDRPRVPRRRRPRLGGRRLARAARPPATTACAGSRRSSPRSSPTSSPRPPNRPTCSRDASCRSRTHV